MNVLLPGKNRSKEKLWSSDKNSWSHYLPLIAPAITSLKLGSIVNICMLLPGMRQMVQLTSTLKGKKVWVYIFDNTTCLFET